MLPRLYHLTFTITTDFVCRERRAQKGGGVVGVQLGVFVVLTTFWLLEKGRVLR